MTGLGSGVWTMRADDCQFAYQAMTGDCAMVAQVTSCTYSGSHNGKAGLMIRDNLSATISQRAWIGDYAQSTGTNLVESYQSWLDAKPGEGATGHTVRTPSSRHALLAQNRAHGQPDYHLHFAGWHQLGGHCKLLLRQPALHRLYRLIYMQWKYDGEHRHLRQRGVHRRNAAAW